MVSESIIKTQRYLVQTSCFKHLKMVNKTFVQSQRPCRIYFIATGPNLMKTEAANKQTASWPKPWNHLPRRQVPKGNEVISEHSYISFS